MKMQKKQEERMRPEKVGAETERQARAGHRPDQQRQAV